MFLEILLSGMTSMAKHHYLKKHSLEEEAFGILKSIFSKKKNFKA